MIRSLADDTTRDIWTGINRKAARRIPRAVWPVIQRKLDQIDSVTSLDQLRVPPGNRLHRLADELAAAVGFAVTATCLMRRRSWARSTKTNRRR